MDSPHVISMGLWCKKHGLSETSFTNPRISIGAFHLFLMSNFIKFILLELHYVLFHTGFLHIGNPCFLFVISKIQLRPMETKLIIVSRPWKIRWWVFLLWLQERSHTEFLCRMKDIIPSKSIFIEKTLNSLQKHFVLQPIQPDDIDALNSPYDPSSRLLTKRELEQELLSTGAAWSNYLLPDPFFFRRFLSCPNGCVWLMPIILFSFPVKVLHWCWKET